MNAQMAFPLQFKRQYKGPLDADLSFNTDVELQAYLTNGLRYAGMFATCLEHEGKLFIMNNAETAWIQLEGLKGDVGDTGADGFTPIPEITVAADGVYLNFIVGYEDLDADPLTNPTPKYAWAQGINIKGDKGDAGTAIEVGAGKFDVDFTVKGTTIGMYSDGDVIPTDTSVLAVLKNILTTIENPIYDAPTIVLTTSDVLVVESDTTITPTINSVFTQHDAGTLTGFRIKEDGVAIVADVAVQSPFTQAAFTIVDDIVTYVAEADYNDGTVKQTNMGIDYPAGQIMAGTKVSNALIYKGVRKAFYGTDSVLKSALLNSTSVRALNGFLNVVEGTVLDISIPVGATMVTFAYPETLRDVSSVIYIEGMNAEIKSAFTKSTVSVAGAEGGNAVNYKVYTYIPAVPFPNTVNYKVII